MDFIAKFKLNFEWDEFDQSELYLVNRKAQIKTLLQIVTVPTDTPRVHSLDSGGTGLPDLLSKSVKSVATPSSGISNDVIAFEVACMKMLDKSNINTKKSVEEQLKMHDSRYVQMIKTHPELLNPSFTKGEPAHGVFHRIDTPPGHPPCKTKRRPIIMNSAKAAAGKAAWEQMIKDGVVEQVKAGTNTEYSSALHIVDKPGGGARPCTDFRALNQMTVVDGHPLSLLKDFTGKIHGAEIFSVIDIRSAFFNVPILPEHRYKTLTLSPWGGSYIYNRLPFGLSSGPSTWQKLLEHVLRGIDNCSIYLDDVLCCSKTQEEHDATLKEIFKRLAKNDMALSIDKCKFGRPEVDYLGYHVTSTGIRLLKRKLDVLKQFQPPQSQKDVLHFCGALNYFRTSLRGIKLPDGHIKTAAEVFNLLQPLYAIGTDKLPKGKFQEVWNNSKVLKKAFEESKQMLGEAVELVHPNPNYPLALFTDASDYSIGGSLQMLDPDGSYKPLGFYSAHLNPTQKKYSVFKKELLGAFKSVRHFLPEIYGKHCTIYTDHLPLQMAFQSNKIPLNDPQVYQQITERSFYARCQACVGDR